MKSSLRFLILTYNPDVRMRTSHRQPRALLFLQKMASFPTAGVYESGSRKRVALYVASGFSLIVLL